MLYALNLHTDVDQLFLKIFKSRDKAGTSSSTEESVLNFENV